MGDLSELELRTAYHKGKDDIAESFYLPCLRRSTQYDRAVGYFRSTIFVIAWPALKDFVRRGGAFRILCSQVLADEDIDALEEGYSARTDAVVAAQFASEVQQLLADPVLHRPARVLAALVASRKVEFKVAILRLSDLRTPAGRIFHDKLGFFRDSVGNTVMFKGSMNETWTGLSSDGNIESVDVSASWMGARDLERTRNEEEYFSALWNDRYPTLSIRPFPEVAKNEFERAADPDWEGTVGELVAPTSRPQKEAADAKGRTLKPHQSAGLAAWDANGRRGILAFATGSGKTFTAVTAIRDAISLKHEVVLVVVPDQVLFAQWYTELGVTLRDLNVRLLRAGAGNPDWRGKLRLWTEPGDLPRLVLATAATASSEDFRARLARGGQLFIVADEVHRLGSTRNRLLLDESLFGPRLGLSATPERAGDPLGTAALLSFFDRVLLPRYTLSDAIRDRVLTPYFYRPHTVSLSESEAADWRAVSAEIAQVRARLKRSGDSQMLQDRLQRLLIKRARIVKHAAGKVPLAVHVLTTEYQRGQRWIVYCEDLSQLGHVCEALGDAGISSIPFHSQMTGNRAETLNWLDRRGGVVVAIKCLDEGVDVPSVTHALILASSKNPREFVQRRGRVLRTAPNKALAYVHDAIVLAPRVVDDDGNLIPDPVTAGELARAVEFAQGADNPGSGSDLQQIAIDGGLDWRSLLSTGEEDDDEND